MLILDTGCLILDAGQTSLESYLIRNLVETETETEIQK